MSRTDVGEMPKYPQGEPAFVCLLKKHVPFTAHWDEKAQPKADELNLKPGVFLKSSFPDPEKLLETAYADFNRFLSEAALAGNAIPVTVRESAGFSWEEYRLTIQPDSIVLEASDTEGIRRGLYYLSDRIAGSPYLEKGSITRKPWLKNRISRCFFGPIKRPPFNIDELMNDIDYYPEEYLSCLAHEGINGLWLMIVFREICDTSLRKAPPEAARRIAKLRTTVERCRRYGIKTWVFCIEPAAWCGRNPLPPGCEDLVGPGYSVEEAGEDIRSFCVNSEKARKYLYECGYSLFSAVPNLGGIITISHGERMTSCLSRVSVVDDSGTIPCAKRCGKSIGDILSDVLSSLKKGMNAANPQAELISWLYMPLVQQLEKLLARDFSEAKHCLQTGSDIGEFLSWNEEIAEPGKTYGSKKIRWSVEADSENVTFHLDFDSAGRPRPAGMRIIRFPVRNSIMHRSSSSGWNGSNSCPTEPMWQTTTRKGISSMTTV